MRLSDMKPAEQLIAERRADPSFRSGGIEPRTHVPSPTA